MAHPSSEGSVDAKIIGPPRSGAPAAGVPETSAPSSSPEALRSLLDLAFDRTYLPLLTESKASKDLPPLLTAPETSHATSQLYEFAWRRVARLPAEPALNAGAFLLPRWQRMLTTLHAWQPRFVIVLLRTAEQSSQDSIGERSSTRLFFGVRPLGSRLHDLNADVQLEQAVAGELAGLELKSLLEHQATKEAENSSPEGNTREKWAIREQLELPLARLSRCGAITGLPSGTADNPINKGDHDAESGLGRLASGLKGPGGRERSYAIVIVADAVVDARISDVIDRLRTIGETIHPSIRTTEQESKGRSQAEQALSLGQRLRQFTGALLPAVTGIAGAATTLAGGAAIGWTAGRWAGQLLGSPPVATDQIGSSLGKERIDMVAQHCKALVERHIDRLMRGRSVGFWNTGIYVLGDSDNTVSTICGMLRASYSGTATQIEPVRPILFPQHLNASKLVQDLQHVPFPSRNPSQEWHLLGELYQYVSTPLTTEELAVATELPRRDAPGLRIAKNLVRFSLNAPMLPNNARPITLGKLMGSGAIESGEYRFDLNSLVRHGLLVGTTGSGKSTTCRRLIAEAASAGASFLIIEPVKDDYARWALEQNKSFPEKKKITVYMPGADDFAGHDVKPLFINPFEPACRKGQDGKPIRTPDVLGRLERVASILNASMPMQEALPILLESAVMQLGMEYFGPTLQKWPLEREDGQFPLLEKLKKWAHDDLFGSDGESPRYDPHVRQNLFAALQSRIDSLTRGRRGQTLNVPKSIEPEILFEQPAVVNLSRFGGEADRALVMALLLVGLCEYRMDCYSGDPSYRDQAHNGRLFHLAVVEEAHTVLRRPEPTFAGAGNPQAVVARMFSDMLAEVRQYGQGLLVIDQDPSQLISGTIKNTSFRIVHKLPHQEDRAALAASMMLTGDQSGFLAVLPPGQAVILTDHDDAACWISIRKCVQMSISLIRPSPSEFRLLLIRRAHPCIGFLVMFLIPILASASLRAEENLVQGAQQSIAQAVPSVQGNGKPAAIEPSPPNKSAEQKPIPGEQNPPPSAAQPSVGEWLNFAGWLALASAVGFAIGFVVGRVSANALDPELAVAETPGAIESFRRHYREFEDLYGEIWGAAENDHKKEHERSRVLAHWREQLRPLEGSIDAPLLEAWNRVESYKGAKTARDKARIWLEALEAWGLERMWSKEIDVNDQTLKHFEIYPRNLRRAIVTAPCWLYEGMVLKKGEATATRNPT
jgi:hypothetical protein